MHLRTPNMTPLVGVLLVVFIAVSTDLRMLTVDVPRRLDDHCQLDCGGGLWVGLRPDLGTTIRGGGVIVESEPGDLARTLRSVVETITPDDAPAQQIVINVEPDEEVRWGDLVSTFDTMRGVAPDAFIALVPRSETVTEGWR